MALSLKSAFLQFASNLDTNEGLYVLSVQWWDRKGNTLIVPFRSGRNGRLVVVKFCWTCYQRPLLWEQKMLFDYDQFCSLGVVVPSPVFSVALIPDLWTPGSIMRNPFFSIRNDSYLQIRLLFTYFLPQYVGDLWVSSPPHGCLFICNCLCCFYSKMKVLSPI